jgi:hypothetical protein
MPPLAGDLTFWNFLKKMSSIYVFYSYPPSMSEVWKTKFLLAAVKIGLDSSSEKIGLDSSKDESSPGGDAEVKGPCADS